MELEKFIIKKIQETTDWGWVLSIEDDVIDVMIRDAEDIIQAEEGMRFMIEIFIGESDYTAKPIKYKLWNKNDELSGVSDPEQQTEMISFDEALRNGEEAMHAQRKSKGADRKMLTDILAAGRPVEIGTLFNPKHKKLIFLDEGYLMEYIDYPHRRDVVGFFQPRCVAIPMSPLNNLMVVGGEACVVSLDTKHTFSLMHKFEEARFFYRHFKQENLARTDKYFNDLKTKTSAERYLILLEEHPWILEHVDPEDIASYLKISVEEYQKILRVE